MNLSEMSAEQLLEAFTAELLWEDKRAYRVALRAELLRRLQGHWNEPEMEPEADGEYLIRAFFSVANHGVERTDLGLWRRHRGWQFSCGSAVDVRLIGWRPLPEPPKPVAVLSREGEYET